MGKINHYESPALGDLSYKREASGFFLQNGADYLSLFL